MILEILILISIEQSALFQRYCEECCETWLACTPCSIKHFPAISRRTKIENYTTFQAAYKKVQHCMQQDHVEEVHQQLLRWLHDDQIWKLQWLKKEDRDIFHEVSKQFLRDARSFDQNLQVEDMVQAIRNVWIIIILAKIFHKEFYYHKAIFAYSMLYPYTDNLLDDPTCKHEKKKMFNQWLYKRINGECDHYYEPYQRRVHMLITMIEEQYPRDSYNEVYTSLLLIQQGQEASLMQYDTVDQKTLLHLSIAKGGASVVADGILIDGKMEDIQYQFCVYFGFLLQIADDIQDVQEDSLNGYHTLANVIKSKQAGKNLCEKYFSYGKEIMQKICPNQEEATRLFITENCRTLLYFSLCQKVMHLPKRFLYQVHRRMPIRKKDMKQLMKTLNDNKTIDPHLLDAYLQI